ncbi:hypothetical protein Tdes44962_MAKER00949 [Teratosphaeria destructans]|uniref:Uncharacterized protein n=1 Tax=Teratosphaeria destructans TaxID=418781 RepID=A0A9W7VYF8_9PEZI|nr:hypothetical protein Tdes44962_MAKER00949 [Teratosphaeria destructans]
MSSPLTVLRFSCWHFSDAVCEVNWWPSRSRSEGAAYVPSLVMKEMNSLTHSCMHSLASFAILAFSGKAVFMIRATGAKLWMLASLSQMARGLRRAERIEGWEGDDCGDGEEGMAIRRVDGARRRLQMDPKAGGWGL